MRRRHIIGADDKTLCGWALTERQLQYAKYTNWTQVNCKRCLEKKERTVHTVYEGKGNHRIDL